MKYMIAVARIIITIIVGIVFLFFYARYLENKSLYYPIYEIENTPADINIAYKDVFFYSEDNIKINGWLVKSKNAKTTIIFAHGNGGNISHRLDKINFFNKLGLNILIFDYRGYGKSAGVPSEQGLYLDIQAAYKFIKKEQSTGAIIVYGESLGGAIAIDLAQKDKEFDIDGLILEGTFTNITDMARLIYPFLPTGFLKTKFDSISKISNIKTPKLHFHGKNDNIVPFNLGQKLFNAAIEPKKLVALEGQHNDGFFISENLVRKSIIEFMESISIEL